MKNKNKNKNKKQSKQSLLSSFINPNRLYQQPLSKLSVQQQLRQSRQKLCEISAQAMRLHNQMQMHIKKIRRLQTQQPKKIYEDRQFSCIYTTEINSLHQQNLLFDVAKGVYANRHEIYLDRRQNTVQSEKCLANGCEGFGLNLEEIKQEGLKELEQAIQSQRIPSRFFAGYIDGFDSVLQELSSLGP